jgi:hypothetical protein
MKDLLTNIQKRSKKQRLLFFWIAIVASVGFVFALWFFIPGNSLLTEPAAENAETGDVYNEEVGLPELKQSALDFFKEGKEMIVDTKEKVGKQLDQTQEMLDNTEKLQGSQAPDTAVIPTDENDILLDDEGTITNNY